MAEPQDIMQDGAPRPVIDFDGNGADLFGIFIVNLILTILTLGIYRFWAKTRVRRYLWAHAAVGGDRFEYTGTGRELFLGFIIVVFLILLPISLLLTAAQFAFTMYAPDLEWLVQVVYIAILAYLIQVAIYRARRYRMSRSQWRGIRGGLTGSSFVYAGRSFALALASLATLGLLYPLINTHLMRYKLGHSWLGGQQFAFEGNGGPLYRVFLPYWLIMIASYAVIGLAAFQTYEDLPEDFLDQLEQSLTQIEEEAAEEDEAESDEIATGDDAPGEATEPDAPADDAGDPADDVGDPADDADDVGAPEPEPGIDPAIMAMLYGLLGLAVGLFLILRIVWFWYQAAEYRYFAACTRFGEFAFEARVTGWALFWLSFTNRLLLILTLGFGRPWVWVRTGRFMANRLLVSGEMDLDALIQSSQQRPGTGEGLAEALDVGGF